jgi:hypothetical protein
MPTTNQKAQDFQNKPLGAILQQANLISPAQIQLVLQDQKIYTDLKIGEILALRGWVKQETSDFFVRDWLKILNDTNRRPIGYYLKQAGLLDETQIETILEEQKRLWMRFGALAVLQGCVKQGTVDFFLEYVSTNQEVNNPWITKRYDEDFINRPTFILDPIKTQEQEEEENIDKIVRSIVDNMSDDRHAQKMKKDRNFFTTLTESFGKITKPNLDR